jgi:hypothetical protein
MVNYSTLGSNLKRDILNFTRKVTLGLSKPTHKFVTDMVYGIISSKSCKLSEIARSLKEDILLKKVVDRLGRNLGDISESEEDAIISNYLTTVRSSLGSDTMLMIDGGDVTKPSSSKMEEIGSVYDGSTKTFADGYWTMGAVALSDKTQHPIPVYENLYPCKAQGGMGFSAEASKCLQYLRENFDKNIPRVFDRGFDSGSTILELTGKNEMFIMRVNQNRVAVHKGKRTKISDIVTGIVCEDELIFKSKTGNVSKCRIGMTQITLPNMKNTKVNLVVCKEFGENPLVLYTNLSETLESISVRVVKAYLMRWRIEEYYAFKKQGLGFEGFRVRGLSSIKRLDLLLTIACGFIGALCEKADNTIVISLIALSKPITKIGLYLEKTKFLYYAVLAGITEAFTKLRCGIGNYFSPNPIIYQLCIPGFEKMG